MIPLDPIHVRADELIAFTKNFTKLLNIFVNCETNCGGNREEKKTRERYMGMNDRVVRSEAAGPIGPSNLERESIDMEPWHKVASDT